MASAATGARVLRDAYGERTPFEAIEVGRSLGRIEWTPAQSQVDQVCERMEDHHPFYEVDSPFGGTVVPIGMTYLLGRRLLYETYNVRGLLYKWRTGLHGPIKAGTTYLFEAAIAEKWVRNEREFIAYDARCTDAASGQVVMTTRRSHVLDFIKRTAPRQDGGNEPAAEAAHMTAARTTAPPPAPRQEYWDPDWPAAETAARTGRIDVVPLARADSPLGAPLPTCSLHLSRAKFFRRQSQYWGNVSSNLHLDERAAQREGLAAPVASAPDLIALCHQAAMQFFGAGWIAGGQAELACVKPTYVGEYLCQGGAVKSREMLPDGRVRLHCDAWVVNQRGEKKIVGTVSGIAADQGHMMATVNP